jgi:hypothetical protein
MSGRYIKVTYRCTWADPEAQGALLSLSSAPDLVITPLACSVHQLCSTAAPPFTPSVSLTAFVS